MKKILLILTLMISFNSYGEWVKVNKHPDGHYFYIDRDTIKEHKGYVYFWEMADFLTPNQYGTMSIKVYKQGDCVVNRYKDLSYIFYEQPMAGGIGETDNTPSEWEYPSPDTIAGINLWYICDYVE